MKNLTIHSDLTTAHSYRGSLGQAQMPGPRLGLWLAHANGHAQRTCVAQSARVVIDRASPC
jgi:hypothetical protein